MCDYYTLIKQFAQPIICIKVFNNDQQFIYEVSGSPTAPCLSAFLSHVPSLQAPNTPHPLGYLLGLNMLHTSCSVSNHHMIGWPQGWASFKKHLTIKQGDTLQVRVEESSGPSPEPVFHITVTQCEAECYSHIPEAGVVPAKHRRKTRIPRQVLASSADPVAAVNTRQQLMQVPAHVLRDSQAVEYTFVAFRGGRYMPQAAFKKLLPGLSELGIYSCVFVAEGAFKADATFSNTRGDSGRQRFGFQHGVRIVDNIVANMWVFICGKVTEMFYNYCACILWSGILRDLYFISPFNFCHSF